MLWKPAWRRQKTPVGQTPVDAWFFANFGPPVGAPQARYRFPLAVPAPGDGAAPFWVGIMFAATLSTVSVEQVRAFISRAGAGAGYSLFGTWPIIGPDPRPLRVTGSVMATPAPLTNDVPQVGAETRAVVALMTVEPFDTGRRETLWVDGNPVATKTEALPYADAAGTRLTMAAETSVAGISIGINGFAGGNFLPTSQEIRDWFGSTRANLEVAAIPGKTSDRLTATSVAPAVPAVLPNLAGGQNMDYVVTLAPDPVVVNILLPVTFNY
jgi:hypothetical protein